MDTDDVKVGMRVKIKDQIVITKNIPGPPFFYEMYRKLGKTYTVTRYEISPRGYHWVCFDQSSFRWSPDWLELPLDNNSSENTDRPNIHNIYKE